MKRSVIVLLMLTLLSFVFADEDNTDGKDIVFQWPLFNYHFEFRGINLNTIIFNNRNSSFNFFSSAGENTYNQDRSNTEVIAESKNWLGFFTVITGYGIILGDYYNNSQSYMYRDLNDEWNKNIENDHLYQRILGYRE
ncbi:hypothetical protein [Treponema primitia]|uniref:hypothetical protein n=1 Tax=Treponema primitia TaxID=88058 RepID=UPI0012FE664B|nr:hypothetical protein [Treponema primitia]